MSEGRQLFLFLGSYSEAMDHGIYMYRVEEDSEDLRLTLTDQVAGLKNPTFLNVDPNRNILYSISETVNNEGDKVGEAASFAIDTTEGKLILLNRKRTVDSTTCHIQRDSQSLYLSVTSYHGGMIGLLNINPDGQIGELLDVKQHVGSSDQPEREQIPHPHSSFYSPDGRFLFVQDLGLDRIVTYLLDADRSQLIQHAVTELQPGAGPRHFVFHPSGRSAYVINELDSTVTAFAYDAEQGTLSIIGTISTLPEGGHPDNACAEIAISKDGRFVYGSNRGHDSIVVFAVDEETGMLKQVQHISVEGGHPRHFALTPSGQYLIAANRDTNNIVMYRVNASDGHLQYTGRQLTVYKPVCVTPVYLTT